MAYDITISEIVNNVVVEAPGQNIAVTSTSFPITISYNATVLNDGALPTGGTAGQVLAKIDSDNYHAEWIDIVAGSGNMTVSESQPPTAVTGDQWFRASTQVLQVYTGTGWSPIGVDDLQY